MHNTVPLRHMGYSIRSEHLATVLYHKNKELSKQSNEDHKNWTIDYRKTFQMNLNDWYYFLRLGVEFSVSNMKMWGNYFTLTVQAGGRGVMSCGIFFSMHFVPIKYCLNTAAYFGVGTDHVLQIFYNSPCHKKKW